MSRVRHCEYKIEHRGTLLVLVPILLEHARPVRKRVSDRRIKVRNDAFQQRAHRVGHRQQLVSPKRRGKVRECLVLMMRDGRARGGG